MLERTWVMFFALSVFVVPGGLGFILRRALTRKRSAGTQENKLATCSTALFFLNVIVFYACYLIGTVVVHGHTSDVTWSDYWWMLLIHRLSMAGMLISLATIILATFSELDLARRIRTWGSAAALALWPMVYLASSDYLAMYSVHLKLTRGL